MIIWINGSFGVGKTTTAELLRKELDDSIIYDPEEIGGFLSNLFNYEKDDFQDYELWRTLNSEILMNLSSKSQYVIVPMTITNVDYYDEIVKGLKKSGIIIKHFILCATKENIINRLNFRENTTEWTYNQVDRCINVFASDKINGIKINTDNMNGVDIVKTIIDKL